MVLTVSDGCSNPYGWQVTSWSVICVIHFSFVSGNDATEEGMVSGFDFVFVLN